MTIHVYVVDDEPFDRMATRRRLARHPEFAPVEEADDGDTFLETYFASADDGPSLVLMDVNMRRLDGFDALEQMEHRVRQGQGPGSVAVMLSSTARERDVERARGLPVVRDFLTKPLTEDGVARILSLFGAG